MDTTILGRTDLLVSRMGLGCGGHSRLGLSTGSTEAQAEEVVREALALGINFIDTAEAYRTEDVVGRGIAGTPRDRIVLSTKAGVHWEERLSTQAELRSRVEACLQRLRTDYVDVFHLHGIAPADYRYARDELLPVLLDMRTEGKIRFLGITEQYANDTPHRMLEEALRDDHWDVVMVGFNILNQTARERVLPITQSRNIGTLDMFAVRRALSRPEALRDVIDDRVAKGELSAKAFDRNDPLGFLVHPDVAKSVTEAAYRYCRWEPGMDVVLSGTGSVAHLRENAHSLLMPPLPGHVLERLAVLFAGVDSISGN
jgi:aryl-alcohol dehydrogenase-like predicted oxidoreductase